MKYFIIPFFLFNILFLSSQDKWTYLIDDDLSNWEIKEGNAEFIIDDGIITGTSILKSPSTYLGTKMNYKDFILEFEVNVSSGLNSGVQFRSLKSNKFDITLFERFLKSYKESRVSITDLLFSSI